MQVVAPAGGDRILLALAQQLEQAYGWAERRSALA
jgi:Asp-tRNA(Asn)/Glu-tRNA(Gln) amidotransferase A subunit family amidase